jgi:hypothetical protein
MTAPGSGGQPTEPMSRGTIVVSIGPAVRDVWGEAQWQSVLDHLPRETAVATTGANLMSLTWYPTRYLQDYEHAIFEGPAKRDEDSFRRYIDRRIDMGFGRVRRSFLRFATPQRLVMKASELWRHDQTHGLLKVDSFDDGISRLSLRGHPYVSNPLSRMSTAEVMRHILSLSRYRDVRETHALVEDALVMTLLWKDRRPE